MKIVDSRVAMESQSASWQRQEASLRLTGRKEGASGSRDEAAARLQEAGRQMQTSAAIPTEPVQEEGDLSPSLQVLKRLLEWALGRSIDLVEVRQIETPSAEVPAAARVPEDSASSSASSGTGLGGTLTVRTLTVEQLSFSASGRVQTADGRSIEFSLGLALTRATATEVRAAFGAEAQDPLVLDFAGTEAELRDFGFRFDLHGDGAARGSSCSIAMAMAASTTDGSSSVRAPATASANSLRSMLTATAGSTRATRRGRSSTSGIRIVAMP